MYFLKYCLLLFIHTNINIIIISIACSIHDATILENGIYFSYMNEFLINITQSHLKCILCN